MEIKSASAAKGGIMFTINPELYEEIRQLEAAEASCEIVAYCAGCRNN